MANIPVIPVAGNTHQSVTFAKLLEPKFSKIFFSYLKEHEEQYSKVYNMKTSDRSVERELGLGGFTDWTQRADNLDTVAYQKLSPGLERTYTHKAFTSGFIVERELYDDEMYDQMDKLPRDLARAGRGKVEKDAITPFVNAFSADVGGVGASAIYDGKALCAADHPLVEGGTSDNLASGPLTESNLKAALIKLRGTKGEAGDLVVIKAKKLIIPPSLEYTARTIMNTTQVTGSNNNDVNTIKGLLDIEVMDYLGSASTANVLTDAYWFIQADSHEMNFYWRVKPEFKALEEFDNFAAKYRGYMRYSFGVSDWRGIIGSPGV
jgi:phage major head subunit gpT-like protein